MIARQLCSRALQPSICRQIPLQPWKSPLTHSRIFATSFARRKDDTPSKPPPFVNTATPENVKVHQHGPKPEVKTAGPAKDGTLLSEQVKTNEQQRKADWAIMKEMSRYLWPKDNLGTRFRVGLSVALLLGAKVILLPYPSRMYVGLSCIGPHSSSTILLQVYCRLHER